MLTRNELLDRFKTGKKPTGEDFTKLINGVIKHKEIFVATGGQKIFTLANKYSPHAFRLTVVVGGVPQFSPENFTETSNTSITMNEGLVEGTEVIVIYSE